MLTRVELASGHPFDAVYDLPGVVVCSFVTGVSDDHAGSFNIENLLRS